MKNRSGVRAERVPSWGGMGRTSRLLPALCFVTCLAGVGPAPAQDAGGVYRVRDREGRTVYTNLEGLASHGRALETLDLPPLNSIDFEHAAPEELRQIDSQVRESHSALQAGEPCDAIRRSSRVPLRTRVWDEHRRKLYVAAALLGFAMLLGYLCARRKLGTLLPIAPFAGCVFLGYATYQQTHEAMQALTSGLRACSEQLPEGQPDDAPAVKSRLARALDIRRSIGLAYDQQARDIDAIMRER
jgi:hypothetical protein